MADEDSPYDFADEPPPQKRPALPEKPRPPAAARTAPARAPDAAAAPAAPATAAVERTCPHCGFTFLGKPKARCPECAAALDSSAAELLQFADTGWVRSVALGVMLIVPAIITHIIGCALKWVHSSSATHAKGMFHGTGAVLLLAGVFIATRKEPGSVRGFGSRLSIRLLALFAAVIWGIFLFWAFDAMTLFPGAVKFLLDTVLLTQAVMAVMLGFYFRGLAMRIPDDSLASHTSLTGWCSALACLTMAGLYFLEMTQGFYPSFFMCSFPMVAGFLAIFIWTMITLLRLGLNMRAAAEAGESIARKRIERAAARKKPA